MKCLNCKHENAQIKKSCENCGKFIEGFTMNNVSGEYGYRDHKGYFHSMDSEYVKLILEKQSPN